MNWVAPIKDEDTLRLFGNALKEVDYKYYIMFEVGVGTGLQLQDILSFKVKDVRDKDEITVEIGTKNIKNIFKVPEDLKKTISVNIKHMIKLFKENIVAEAEPEAKALLYIDFAREIAQLSNTLIKYDREIEKKRGMLLAIEKESGMTMAAMLRTIPKKQEQGTNPLLEVLCSE